MVEITENLELRKIWWLKLPKTLKYSKSDGWSRLKHWRTQNLMVESTKTLKNAKSDGWSWLIHLRTKNLIVEVLLNTNLMVEVEAIRISYGWSSAKTLEERKIWWLKSHKTLKYAKSNWSWSELCIKPWSMQNLMVEDAKNIEGLKIWWLKLPKTLKCSKSDGWRTLKRWRTQNLMVEITENIELRQIWWKVEVA